MISQIQAQFPNSNTPLVAPNGVMTTTLMQFLRAIYNRTGQETGIPFTTNSAVAGAGTTQADATLLDNDWNAVASTSGGGGVILSSLTTGQQQTVFNNTGGNLKLYPPLGGTITWLSVSAGLNNAITLAAADFVICYFFSPTNIQAA